MVTLPILGNNYSFDGQIITFFGHSGFELSPDSWFTNLDFIEGAWFQEQPSYFNDRVRALVAETVDGGYQDLLHLIMVGPRQAVLFFLGGLFEAHHLSRASETADFIDIPGVEVDDRVLTVRVSLSFMYAMATADRNGDLLIRSRS